MAEGRPRLVAVPDPHERAEQRGERRPGGRRAVWLLGAGLVLSLLGWGLASHEASTLSRALAAKERALAEALGRLQAAEAQRAQVLSQVEALAAEASAFAGRLGELEALLASDPAPATDAQPTGKEDERAD